MTMPEKAGKFGFTITGSDNNMGMESVTPAPSRDSFISMPVLNFRNPAHPNGSRMIWLGVERFDSSSASKSISGSRLSTTSSAASTTPSMLSNPAGG